MFHRHGMYATRVVRRRSKMGERGVDEVFVNTTATEFRKARLTTCDDNLDIAAQVSQIMTMWMCQEILYPEIDEMLINDSQDESFDGL